MPPKILSATELYRITRIYLFSPTFRAAMHLPTSASSLLVSVMIPERFPPHILSSKITPIEKVAILTIPKISKQIFITTMFTNLPMYYRHGKFASLYLRIYDSSSCASRVCAYSQWWEGNRWRFAWGRNEWTMDEDLKMVERHMQKCGLAEKRWVFSVGIPSY